MRTKLILLFCLLSVVILFTTKCTKTENSNKPTGIKYEKVSDPGLIEKVIAFQNENSKKGISVLYYNSEEAGIKSRVENVKYRTSDGNTTTRVTCSGVDGAISTNVIQVTYTNGDCFTVGNYKAEQTKIKVFLPTGGSLITTTNIPITFHYGSTNINTTANVTSHTAFSNIYNLTVADVLLNDYCSISTLDVIASLNVQCSDGSTSSGDVTISNNIATFRADICYHVSPALFQPNVSGLGTAGLNGWYPCTDPSKNPCMSSADAIEFSYRKVGVTTWTVFTLKPYLSNAVTVSSLSSGTYEYTTRNIRYQPGTSTIDCVGPSSNIRTAIVN
jgi:hypothetical protein